MEKLISEDNIRLAIIQAGTNKNKHNRRHWKLRYIKANVDKYVPVVREWILNFLDKDFKHKPVEINDGIAVKKRIIVVPTVEECIVHHAVTNVLKDIVSKSMYEHSYASIPGHGTHKATKAVKKWIRKKNTNTKYCLQLDIKKFFDSVDQDILLSKLSKIIRDKQYYKYLEKIIRTTSKGIPLGFTTSQWFANFLLTELDHKIKQLYGVKYYIRFMDDMVIFGSNKRKLHKIKDRIELYLNNVLNLTLKSNWQVFLMDTIRGFKKGRFLDFLGFKFYREYTGLRSKIALRVRRKAKRIFKKGKPNIHDVRQMVTYAGLVKYANCYKWFQKYVLTYVSIKYLRRKISKYDKRQRRLDICGNMQNPLLIPK